MCSRGAGRRRLNQRRPLVQSKVVSPRELENLVAPLAPNPRGSPHLRKTAVVPTAVVPTAALAPERVVAPWRKANSAAEQSRLAVGLPAVVADRSLREDRCKAATAWKGRSVARTVSWECRDKVLLRNLVKAKGKVWAECHAEPVVAVDEHAFDVGSYVLILNMGHDDNWGDTPHTSCSPQRRAP